HAGSCVFPVRDRGFPVRIAARHPVRDGSLFRGDGPQIEAIRTDIEDESSLAAAVAGMGGVVNAVSLISSVGPTRFIRYMSGRQRTLRQRRVEPGSDVRLAVFIRESRHDSRHACTTDRQTRGRRALLSRPEATASRYLRDKGAAGGL